MEKNNHSLNELINDLMVACKQAGYNECRFVYCEKDEIAAKESFDALISLAKKYNVGFSDLLEYKSYRECWEYGDYLSDRIARRIIIKIKEESE